MLQSTVVGYLKFRRIDKARLIIPRSSGIQQTHRKTLNTDVMAKYVTQRNTPTKIRRIPEMCVEKSFAR
jgi:hypothetical protein